MLPVNPKDLDLVRGSDQFDAEWYRQTYRDVAQLGMDPAEHYLKYGVLLRRDPGPHFVTGYYLDTHGGLQEKNVNPLVHYVKYLKREGREPDLTRNNVLWAAYRMTQRGDSDRAIAFAEKDLPENLTPTAQILRANAALAARNETGWLEHLNAYLGHVGLTPITLEGEGSLFNRLSSVRLPEVTGGPLISVIMPAWNAEATIDMATRSILKQTWRNLELLIVDDASDDNTWGRLQAIAAGDSRVRIFRNKVNVGPYVSKNTALAHAQGEYVTGHDADDWAHPKRLENHLAIVQSSSRQLRASLTYMIRMQADGKFAFIGKVGGFSFDGVTRKSSISCLLERKFLIDELGAWDCVRFGADSELMARAKKVLGPGYRELEEVGMLCLDSETGLTNHPEYGVDRVTGPSDVRLQYSESWKKWQSQTSGAGLRLSFPPAERAFSVPDVMSVDPAGINRNYHTALVARADAEPVTAICVSKRPHLVGHVAAILKAQTYGALKVIYVAHGKNHDLDAVRKAFADFPSFRLLQVTDEDTVLADGLNMALEVCDTDIVAKIDDDDYYGPNYIANSVVALRHSGSDNVALTGKARHFCFIESQNAFGLRFPSKESNTVFRRVHGGTLVWSRTKTDDQRFERVPRGTDSAFIRGLHEKQLHVYSSDPYDFVHIRYADTLAHTWQIEDLEFMKPVTVLASGLRLDLAYSGQVAEAGVSAVLPKNERLVSE